MVVVQKYLNTLPANAVRIEYPGKPLEASNKALFLVRNHAFRKEFFDLTRELKINIEKQYCRVEAGQVSSLYPTEYTWRSKHILYGGWRVACDSYRVPVPRLSSSGRMAQNLCHPCRRSAHDFTTFLFGLRILRRFATFLRLVATFASGIRSASTRESVIQNNIVRCNASEWGNTSAREHEWIAQKVGWLGLPRVD